MMWLWMVHIECRKSLELKYVKKWNPFCNWWVFVRNRVTSKEIVQFVHEVHPVFSRSPLNFLAHATWVKLCHHANFQPFQSSFAVLFNFRVILAQNKSWNAWKIANEVRKGLKIDDVALNAAYWMQKKSGVKIC